MKVRECPFCESTRMEIVEADVMGKPAKRVKCMCCRAEGPVFYGTGTNKEAIAHWNSRAEFRSWSEVGDEG